MENVGLLTCGYCHKTSEDRNAADDGPAICVHSYAGLKGKLVYTAMCTWCGLSGPVCDSSDEAIKAFNSLEKRHPLEGHKVPDYLRIQGLLRDNKRLLGKLGTIRSSIMRSLKEIDDIAQERPTGWYVLLKELDNGGYECVDVVSPDKMNEDSELPSGWDLIVPICDPSKEFDGF